MVVVSSIGARIANPFLGMYHASKYGLLALTEALAVEGRQFGIRVSTVEPGMVDTDFPRAIRRTGAAPQGEGPYAPLLDAMRSGFAAWRRDYPTGPDEVAEAVVAAALDPDPPFRVPVGDDARRLGALREGEADDRVVHQGLADFLGLDWSSPPR